jgi:hypothetical protein
MVAGSATLEAVMQSLFEPQGPEVPLSASLVNVSSELDMPATVETARAKKELGSESTLRLPLGRAGMVIGTSVSERNVIVATLATLVRVTTSLGTATSGPESKKIATWAFSNVKPGHETVKDASRPPSGMGVVVPAEQAVCARVAQAGSNDATNVSKTVEAVFIQHPF